MIKLILLTLIVVLPTFLTTTSIVHAQPMNHESVASFIVLESEKPSYVLGDDDEVIIRLEVEYTGAEEKILLEAEITVIDSTGNIVFESERDLGEVRITLRSGNSATKRISWQISDSTEEGIYTITGILFESGKSRRNPFDERNEDDGITFEISEKPDLRLSRTQWRLDDFEEGQISEETFFVRNRGGGTITWEVTEWPEWVELVSPDSEVTGEGEILVRVAGLPTTEEVTVDQRCGYPLCYYEATTSPLLGEIIVVSNVGEFKIGITFDFGEPGLADGEVTRFKVSDKEYKQGEEALIEYEVENTGDVPMEYRVHLTIYHFSESFETTVAYDSDRDDSYQEKEDRKITLQPGETKEFTHVWPVSFRDKTGDYFLETWLRYWDEWDVRFDHNFIDVRHGFEVKKGRRQPILTISPSSIDLGTISQGDTLEAKLTIKNTAFGTLRWSVKEVPDWLELIDPSSQVVGEGEVLVRVKDSAPAELLTGAIAITSNAGTATVDVTLNVQALPTPSPTATPTPVIPTATVLVPTAISIAAPPTRTPESVQVVSSPTPSPTLEITSTPTELPATPTTEPTSISVIASPTKPSTPTSAPTAVAAAPTPQALAILVTPASTEAVQPAVEKSPDLASDAPSSGACNARADKVSITTGIANFSLLFAPIGLIVAIRRRKRS